MVVVVIASVWRRRKGWDGGRERKSVREEENSQGSRSPQYATPERETRLTPCTRSPGLWDANVEREPVDTLDGATRFRLLRSCWTYEDAFVSQAGTRMTCSSREGASVLSCKLTSLHVWWISCAGVCCENQIPARVQCTVSPCGDPGHPPKE